MVSTSGAGRDSRRVDNLAVAVGLGVAALTVASQVGLGPADFFTVALLGLAGTTLCATAVMKTRSWRSWLAMILSLLPVALLVYFLAATDG